MEGETNVVAARGSARIAAANVMAVAYHDPFDDVWVEIERFNALVEPCRLTEGGAAEQDLLFAILADS